VTGSGQPLLCATTINRCIQLKENALLGYSYEPFLPELSPVATSEVSEYCDLTANVMQRNMSATAALETHPLSPDALSRQSPMVLRRAASLALLRLQLQLIG
jgi:hypothetical protein